MIFLILHFNCMMVALFLSNPLYKANFDILHMNIT